MNDYLKIGKEILTKLKQNGYEAFFVGGYVRDKILGIKSDDIDITTSALPEEVESLFDKVVDTGKNFGGVTIIIDEFKYEVTTFRVEGFYKNHRSPSEVSFSKNLEDDLKRRDFTVNALVMDETEKIHDYFNGLKDIENKVIKSIGNPLDRFDEDALRMLRAFRFVSKLDFDIDKNTLEAIKTLKQLIETISIERVMVELDKTFLGDYQKKAIKYMIDSGVSKELYGLEKGLEFISGIDEYVYPLEIYIISFILDDINPKWRFSNNNLRLIYQIINLHEVTKEDTFNKYIIFSNKLDPCLLANKINVLLGFKDQEDLILDLYNDMTVHDVCDLKFKGQDILALTSLKKRSVIGLVIDDLLFNVIMGIMPNEYNVLKEFALRRVEELQREMGDTDE